MMNIRQLDWEETFVDRGDGSKEADGWEADTGFNQYYIIEQYFGSDSFGWKATLGFETVADCDDPDRAKRGCQHDFECRVKAAVSSD